MSDETVMLLSTVTIESFGIMAVSPFAGTCPRLQVELLLHLPLLTIAKLFWAREISDANSAKEIAAKVFMTWILLIHLKKIDKGF